MNNKAALAYPISLSPINWEDPKLSELLSKSENWTFDNRLEYPPKEVDLHIGWEISAGKKAKLLLAQNDLAILSSSFRLFKGDNLRINKTFNENTHTLWGIVKESRPGTRPNDNGVFIHWVHIRKQ